MHDVPLPIVYDARGNADRSLDRFSSGNPLEDTVLSLPLLTRFNDSIRESCHHDFLLPSGWIRYRALERARIGTRFYSVEYSTGGKICCIERNWKNLREGRMARKGWLAIFAVGEATLFHGITVDARHSDRGHFRDTMSRLSRETPFVRLNSFPG